MKSALFLILISLTLPNVFGQTIVTNNPLKRADLIKLVNQSVDKFLHFEGEEISGGLYGVVRTPKIIKIVKENDEVKELTVKSFATFMSFDYEFGDPVHEEDTACETTLEKVAGLYSLENTKTTCNYNPAV